ncbi:MAG: type II toxin-antitoxin system PemK/MazF family toxin [Patescibacteria group bacterium]
MNIKRFLEWIGLKEKLDSIIHQAPHVSEGEIWWASIGENVGAEINGKSQDFSRPVIIFRKLAHGFYLVIPTTTKIKSGTWYVKFREKNLEVCACLHQLRSIDYRRLHRRLGELEHVDFEQIKIGFKNLYH